ncbi:MAG: hypothetical protein MK066_11450 [Crocinitomicaceae bacterium]|nr:hypothetical protein [Crocinitomicaceae bacterium]
MKKYLGIVLVAGLIVSCGGETKNDKSYKTEVPEASVLIEGIKVLEDSVLKLSMDLNGPKQMKGLAQQALIEKLLLLYRTYPKHEKAPSCLDKVQMAYSTIGVHELAAKFADTLLMKYPKYENRLLIIESQITNYDQFIKPRDKEKVKSYYEMIFKDFPNLSEEKKEDYQFRLDNIDLTFDELIEKQMERIK